MEKPDETPMKVINAIRDRYQHKDAEKIIHELLQWDSLNGCWGFWWLGVYVGVENDGYMHT